MTPRTAIGVEHIRALLEKHGFENIKENAKGYTCRCKFHDDHAPSFWILKNGVWGCFVCNVGGNLAKLHDKLGDKLTWKDELKIVGLQMQDRFVARPQKKRGVMPGDFNKYTAESCPPYVLDRLKFDTISHFHLGESNEYACKDRCIIPVMYKFKPMGFHGRSLFDNVKPRYYNSPGFDIKEFVFNYDGCEKGKEVIVCEGAFNAMSMWEKGFKNTIATFGTKFTTQQIHKIFTLAPESIVICFDRDSSISRPGQKAAMHLASLTYQLIPTYIMPLPLDKDPNNLPADVLLSCYQKRIAYEKVRIK